MGCLRVCQGTVVLRYTDAPAGAHNHRVLRWTSRNPRPGHFAIPARATAPAMTPLEHLRELTLAMFGRSCARFLVGDSRDSRLFVSGNVLCVARCMGNYVAGFSLSRWIGPPSFGYRSHFPGNAPGAKTADNVIA